MANSSQKNLAQIKMTGLGIFVLALLIFGATLSMNDYRITGEVLQASISDETQRSAIDQALADKKGRVYASVFDFLRDVDLAITIANESHSANIGSYAAGELRLYLTKNAGQGLLADNLLLFFFLSIVLACIGGLMYILPQAKESPPGIRNNHLFTSPATSRGWIGIIAGACLIGFYVFLYWAPEYIAGWIAMLDPISYTLNGGPASQWFFYGFLYTVSMLVMGIRMAIKYRHNRYQLVRTASVLFFQTAFAFLIPEILAALNQPTMDFKFIWPLDYDFFYGWNLDALRAGGGLGWFILFWGVALILLVVPVLTYFFGKRWYCSWVCGCGGLAETVGDPYRHLSDKSLKAWNVERVLIHAVLVFAVVMTGITLTNYFSNQELLGAATNDVQQWYGFLIGAVFAGVVGTGFYPLMGNRVWCRFGCPLAAILGIIQRFKSRFRITTNGGQCMSCGNCSTYCEMGIDVRWYAQRGQDIVRASCVGCGICSAVCPRGVLKLENGSEETRNLDILPILHGGVKQKNIHDKVS